MRRFIYLDEGTLNSYIAQINDGLIQSQEVEVTNTASKEKGKNLHVAGDGGANLRILGKGIGMNLGADYGGNWRTTDTAIIGDVQTKMLHDNAFDHLMEYLRDKEMLNQEDIGSFVQIEDTFYIIDLSYYDRIFQNETFMKLIQKHEIEERKEKLQKQMNEQLDNAGQNDKEKKTIEKEFKKAMYEAENLVKQEYEGIKDIIKILVSAIPYDKTMCISNNLVILNDKYTRDNVDMTAFKYGGKIRVLGYITNRIGDKESTKDLPDIAAVGAAINEVMLAFYSKQTTLNIIHPIAIYYE